MKIKNKVVLISAVDSDYGIGCQGKLLYRFKEDMQFFKETTSNHIVVMGRTTFEEIGKGLPNRINIVLSTTLKNEDVVGKNVHVLSSLEEVFEFSKKFGKVIFFIGGQRVYEESLPYANEVILTHISYNQNGHQLITPLNQPDRFFPYIDRGRIESYTSLREPLITARNAVRLEFVKLTMKKDTI